MASFRGSPFLLRPTGLAQGVRRLEDIMPGPERRSSPVQAGMTAGGYRARSTSGRGVLFTSSSYFLQGVDPLVGFLLGFLPGQTIPFLQLARELVAFAGDVFEVVVGELAPFLLHSSLQLFPISFELIRVHKNSFPTLFGLAGNARRKETEATRGPTRPAYQRWFYAHVCAKLCGLM